MNKVDKKYLKIVKKILYGGDKKGDRTGTGTLSIFSHTLKIDMTKGFPLLTTKKMFTKGIIHELLWFLNGGTNIRPLVLNGVNIWNGDCYAAYIKQIRCEVMDNSDYKKIAPNEFRHLSMSEFVDKIKTNEDFANKWGELGPIYGQQWVGWGASDDNPGVNQIQDLINTLKTNPDSRRMLVSAWNVDEIENMTLPPCFVEGSLVKTISGEYIPIEKVREGDLVLTEDGSYNEVYELMKTKVHDTKLVSFRYCGSPHPIKCTHNHPFLIKGKGYIDAGEMENGDYVAIPIPQKEEDFIINYSLKQNQFSSKNYEEIIDDERQWYLMGYFLGDGWLIEKGETLLSINDTQFELINGKIGGIVPLAKLANSGENVKKYCFKQKKWELILSEFGSGAKNKKIPEFILNGKKELIVKFIEGYEDADGCKTKDGYSITTISDNIAFNMQILYAKVGLKCSLYYQHRPEKTIIEGREVNQNNTYSIQTSKNKNNSDKFIFDGDKLWLRVYDKETIHGFEGTVYNLSVANNHTYTVNNIINHNCHWAFEVYTRELTYKERYKEWFSNNYETGMEYNDDLTIDFENNYWEPTPERALSLKWHQRSVDVGLGLPFNITSYALLLEMLAQQVGMIPETLIGDLTNVHIYSNHVEELKTQLLNKPFELPRLKLNKAKDIYSYSIDDFEIVGYKSHGKINMPLSN